jgi:uncharacterized protein YbbC (DUF1343 family)
MKKYISLSILLSFFLTSIFAHAKIITGAERFDDYVPLLKGKSVGIFANQTSMAGSLHLVDALVKRGVKVVKIFGPEHGFRGIADAGEEIGNVKDPATGIEVISLYGTHNKPTAEDLEGVDIMLYDIQDVGVRFYTYISSLQYYLEAAIENDIPLIILDRPNPNGFYVDGPVLDPKFKSFVGMQPIPIVYGLTIGEYARMLIGESWLDAKAMLKLIPKEKVRDNKNKIKLKTINFKLTIIECKNYTHKSKYVLPVKPSPNLPNIQSIYLYPFTCLFEGTALNEGRGTDKPFQMFGHPSMPKNLISFTPRSTAGAKNPKLKDQLCYGWDLSGTPEQALIKAGNKVQLKWLIQAYKLFPDKEKFFTGSFNRLAGNDVLMQQVKDGKTEAEIRKSWEPALSNYKKIRKKYLLYTDI